MNDDSPQPGDSATILAIDLGKHKSVWCEYHTPDGEHAFGAVTTTRQAIHDLLAAKQPGRLVIEISPSAGWICDVARAMQIEVQVANPNHEGWRWKKVKRKSDRGDALKLAELSALNQLPLVHVPSPAVRQWRTLIRYRRALVDRRTQVKNTIRAILDRESIEHPAAKKGWTKKALAALHELASFDDGAVWTVWRFELKMELSQLVHLDEQIAEAEKKLASIARCDDRVALLKTAPVVGDRLAEAVVAMIDDPHRFSRGRHVGCYVGLTPKMFQSGTINRHGGISGEGDALLRSLLVEVAWLGVSRFNVPWMVQVYENVRRGTEQRKKIAIVAVARRLLIRLWAMLRENEPWREPAEGVMLKIAA